MLAGAALVALIYRSIRFPYTEHIRADSNINSRFGKEIVQKTKIQISLNSLARVPFFVSGRNQQVLSNDAARPSKRSHAHSQSGKGREVKSICLL